MTTLALLGAPHYETLVTGSAIAPALVRERGYQSLLHPEDLIDQGFSKAQAKAAPALGIPLWDVHGQRCGWQIRPDAPRQMRDGKVFRYELPKGDRLILDVHPSVQPRLGDPQEPLWITEGVKKGDALASQGVCAIALVGGVWGFKGTNAHGGKVILPDWEHVALNGREVIVVFDSDLHTNPKVRGALKALYTLLRSRGALPRLVQWTEPYQHEKWGVDDFFAAGHTIEELRAMLPPQGPLPQVPPSPTRGAIPFDLTRGGEVRVVLANILYVFEQDPAWQGVLGFNLLLNDVILLARPPYLQGDDPWVPRPVTERDWSETANWLQRTYQLYVSGAGAGEGLTTYGCRFPFHPIHDYLHSLTWDGTSRLDTWLKTYCHVADTPYSRAVASKTLIAAVARILDPGCKVDTMTILEGEQGLYKSLAWRTLAGDAWFTDNLPDLHDKDAAQTLLGKWLVELAELSQFQRSEIETVKSFLSRQSDHYRPSYGRRAATFPRQQVFVGTTNADHYFKDRTGNRRYWPVTVEAPCDLTALRRDRDQLWAEAVVRYQGGEPWYMDAAQEQLARVEQDNRLEPDDWEQPVLAYAETCYHIASGGTLQYVTTRDVLIHGLNFENSLLHTMGNTKRVANILRANKWKTAPVRDIPNGKQFKALTRPHPKPDDWDTPGPVTPVTAAGFSNNGSSNRVSPNNDTAVTAVTAVTAPTDTKGENKHEKHEKRLFAVLSYPNASMESSGNSGNSAPPLPAAQGGPRCPDGRLHTWLVTDAGRLCGHCNAPGGSACPHCHGTVFWAGAAGQAICARCHPQPGVG